MSEVLEYPWSNSIVIAGTILVYAKLRRRYELLSAPESVHKVYLKSFDPSMTLLASLASIFRLFKRRDVKIARNIVTPEGAKTAMTPGIYHGES